MDVLVPDLLIQLLLGDEATEDKLFAKVVLSLGRDHLVRQASQRRLALGHVTQVSSTSNPLEQAPLKHQNNNIFLAQQGSMLLSSHLNG